MEKNRCAWVTEDKIYKDYHDMEWGNPIHNDQQLFETLMLECMQTGLSWLIVLKKREGYRSAFDNFDINKISRYDNYKVDCLMEDKGIIRHRMKILAIINNANVFKKIQDIYGSFDKFLWAYVDYKPIINSWDTICQIPTTTDLSKQISKDLKKLGFKFLGDITVYSYLQAVGIVNDHTKECFLYKGK